MHYFSHSKLAVYMSCPAKYKHMYLNKVYSKKKPIYYVIGSSVHAFLEKYYEMRGQNIDIAYKAAMEVFDKIDTSLMNPEERRNFDIDKAMTYAMCKAYAKIYVNDFIEFKHMMLERDYTKDSGILLAPDIYYGGKIDGLVQDAADQWWILETKTASDISKAYLDRVHFDSQVLGYMHLAKEKILGKYPSGIIYNVIKKSRFRKTQSETIDQYIARVYEDYDKNWMSKELLVRYRIEINDEKHLDRWVRETAHIASEIANKVENGSKLWPKYTSSCLGMFGQGCPYMQACRDGKYNLLLYEKSTTPEEKMMEKLKEEQELNKLRKHIK